MDFLLSVVSKLTSKVFKKKRVERFLLFCEQLTHLTQLVVSSHLLANGLEEGRRNSFKFDSLALTPAWKNIRSALLLLCLFICEYTLLGWPSASLKISSICLEIVTDAVANRSINVLQEFLMIWHHIVRMSGVFRWSQDVTLMYS